MRENNSKPHLPHNAHDANAEKLEHILSGAEQGNQHDVLTDILLEMSSDTGINIDSPEIVRAFYLAAANIRGSAPHRRRIHQVLSLIEQGETFDSYRFGDTFQEWLDIKKTKEQGCDLRIADDLIEVWDSPQTPPEHRAELERTVRALADRTETPYNEADIRDTYLESAARSNIRSQRNASDARADVLQIISCIKHKKPLAAVHYYLPEDADSKDNFEMVFLSDDIGIQSTIFLTNDIKEGDFVLLAVNGEEGKGQKHFLCQIVTSTLDALTVIFENKEGEIELKAEHCQILGRVVRYRKNARHFKPPFEMRPIKANSKSKEPNYDPNIARLYCHLNRPETMSAPEVQTTPKVKALRASKRLLMRVRVSIKWLERYGILRGDTATVVMDGDVQPGELGYFEVKHWSSGYYATLAWLCPSDENCRHWVKSTGVCLRDKVNECRGNHEASAYGRVISIDRKRQPVEPTVNFRPFDERASLLLKQENDERPRQSLTAEASQWEEAFSQHQQSTETKSFTADADLPRDGINKGDTVLVEMMGECPNAQVGAVKTRCDGLRIARIYHPDPDHVRIGEDYEDVERRSSVEIIGTVVKVIKPALPLDTDGILDADEIG